MVWRLDQILKPGEVAMDVIFANDHSGFGSGAGVVWSDIYMHI